MPVATPVIKAQFKNMIRNCQFSLQQGNHELESIDGAPASFLAYETRWRMPFGRSGSISPLYYSYETGPAHVVMLGSYAAYGPHSKQVGIELDTQIAHNLHQRIRSH